MLSRYLTTDESFSWRVAEVSTAEMVRQVGRDGHAPLHFLLLKGWIALVGDSITAMRGLSVALAALAVGVFFLAVRETLRFAEIGCGGHSGRLGDGGAAADWQPAFAAAMVAGLHPLQVTLAGTARMYSLGVLLAALTMWLLVLALREPKRLRGWLVYGVAAAAFCYTHHFAFFTLLAQAVFVLEHAIGMARRGNKAGGRDVFAGLATATAVAVALYSPWLPVLLFQVEEVWREFWIPPPTVASAAGDFSYWATGIRASSPEVLAGLLLLVGAAAGWTVWQGGWAGRFFAIQAFLPWVCCLVISTIGGRPLLQVRYLAFAQVALFGLWGVLIAKAGPRAKWAIAAVAVGGCLIGLSRLPSAGPGEEHAAMTAVRLLGSQYQPGDLVLATDPAEVNRTLYTAKQLGLSGFDVRCLRTPFSARGHTCHLASLRPENVLWNVDGEWSAGFERVWRLADVRAAGGSAPAGMELVMERTFAGREDSRVTLSLWSRPPLPPKDAR